MSWQHLIPSSTPVCSVPWLCHLWMHSWLDMGSLRGMGKRGVSARRGCTGCGRIEILTIAFWGGGWRLWGYVPLPKIRYGWDAVEDPEVLALGFPLTTVVGKGLKATRGIVTGLPEQANKNMMLLDVPVNPGNSGGPLCDQSGRVVGVVTAKTLSDTFIQGYGLAIPIDEARVFVRNTLRDWQPAVGADAKLEWTAVDANLSKSTVMILISKRRN